MSKQTFLSPSNSLAVLGSTIPLVGFGTLAATPIFPGMDGFLCTLLYNSTDYFYDVEFNGVSGKSIFPDSGLFIAKYTLEPGALANIQPANRRTESFSRYCLIRERLIANISTGGGYASMLLGSLVIFWFADDGDKSLQFASERVLQQLDFPCTAVISPYVPTISEITRAFTTMNQLESGRRFYGSSNSVLTMDFGDIAPSDEHGYPNNLERFGDVAALRISGALAAGNKVVAATHLREALTAIADSCRGQPFPSVLSFATQRFVDAWQYCMADKDILSLKFLRTQDFTRLLLSAPDVEEYVALSGQIIDIIAEEIERHRLEEQKQLLENIAEYIRHNAIAPDICIDSVAKCFDMNPRDMASKFKECYGYGIRDFIHKCRVAAAKELILTTDQPIAAIAEKVGYYSLATMHRAFINHEGVSPGKLRERK